MESAAKLLMEKYPGLKNRIKQVQGKFLDHPMVQELKRKYPDYPFHLGDLRQYINEQENCRSCPGLENCPNMMRGHRLSIVEEESVPRFLADPCEKYIAWQRNERIKKYVKSHHVPEHIMQTTFRDLEMDPGRITAIKEAMKFCATFEREKITKGLYLYGPMGVGKSAIAGAMANELAKRGIDVVMVYVPDFLEEAKSAIKENTIEETIATMKSVSVLILDDIGAESLTEWTRDSVIGRILNYRKETLPTIYTSNFTLQELEEHLSVTRNGTKETMDIAKAKRIMERIEPFVIPIQVLGKNRRREK